MAASVRVPRHQRRETAILAIVLVLTLFWTTARLAEGLGRGRAQELERSGFASVPDVTLYTPAPLSIQAKDISVTDLGAGLGARRYRYEGFKLLVRGEGRLLLIPYSWSTTNAYAYVLPDDDSLLIVFTPVF